MSPFVYMCVAKYHFKMILDNFVAHERSSYSIKTMLYYLSTCSFCHNLIRYYMCDFFTGLETAI